MWQTVRKALSWLLASAVTIIIFGLLAEWAIEVARDKGAFANAGKRFDAVVAAISRWLISHAVLYPLTLLTGIVAGMWLDSVLAHGGRSSCESMQQNDSDSENRKRTLIAQCRDLVAKYMRTIDQVIGGFGSFLSDKTAFLAIRPHLNHRFIEKLERPRTFYVGRDGAVHPPLVADFVFELERLEKEWGLT